MGKNHSFGRAGGTGGEHDLGNVICRHVNSRRRGSAGMQQVFYIFKIQVRQGLHLGVRRRELGDERKLWLRLTQDPGNELRRAPYVKWDRVALTEAPKRATTHSAGSAPK